MMDMFKKFTIPMIIALVFAILAIWLPDTARSSTIVMIDYLKEMILIIPPIFILMGLMEVWIPKDKIKKWLGNDSGIKGVVLSFALGTLPTGPLYIAFPMAGSLLRKGAGIRNMVIFLGSWAALKIPQLMVEIKFLGIAFTSLRFGLTLVALVLMGILMDFLLKKKLDKVWLEQKVLEAEQAIRFISVKNLFNRKNNRLE